MDIGESVQKDDRKKSDPNRPYSLALGEVKDNWSSQHPGMVLVNICVEDGKTVEGKWMPVASTYCVNGAGLYLMPEVGSTVVIGYIDDNSSSPVVLANLWMKKGNKNGNIPDGAGNADNSIKVFCTAKGQMIKFDESEDKCSVEVCSAKDLKIKLDDTKKTISITAGTADNMIEINGESGEIMIKAKSKISMALGENDALILSGDKTDIKTSQLSFDGNSADIKASQTNIEGSAVTVKSSGNLNVESSGMATVKGNMLKLN